MCIVLCRSEFRIKSGITTSLGVNYANSIHYLPKSPTNRQPHPHRPQHPQQGLQRHIAIRTQRLVQRLPRDLALCCHRRHALGARDIVQRGADQRGDYEMAKTAPLTFVILNSFQDLRRRRAISRDPETSSG